MVSRVAAKRSAAEFRMALLRRPQAAQTELERSRSQSLISPIPIAGDQEMQYPRANTFTAGRNADGCGPGAGPGHPGRLGAGTHCRVVRRRLPGGPEQGAVPARREGDEHQGQGRNLHRHRRPAPEGEGRRGDLGRGGQRLGQRGARRRRGHSRKARLQGDRHLQLRARPGRRILRRRRRVLDRAGVEHQDLWRQGPAELGRLLGREEVSRQARLPQGRRRRTRARADGRRRAAEQGVRGVVKPRPASTARSRRSRNSSRTSPCGGRRARSTRS